MGIYTKVSTNGVRSAKVSQLDSAYMPETPEVEERKASVTSRFDDQMTPMSSGDSASSTTAFFKDNDSVKVFVRIRPPNAREIKEGNEMSVQKTSDGSLRLKTQDGYKNYNFDAVVGDNVGQEMLFRTYAAQIVERCLSGYNGCIFAYGQTGSGKTYTMLGDPSLGDCDLNASAGIIPRVFKYLFELLEERQSAMSGNMEFDCKCSFLEIYNETITDLLNPDQKNLQVREDKTGTYAAGLTERSVHSMEDAVELMSTGAANRKVAHTQMNAVSSRSHSILTCIITTKRQNDNGVVSVFRSRLNLVDLAGSERQSSTGARGARLKEASSINKSLSSLGLVIMSLAETKGKKAKHVPYRDSKLTFLLQDSLGGNANAVMISNISPSTKNMGETLSTLRFAHGAKKVKNRVVANHDCEGTIPSLKAEIALLKQELATLRAKSIAAEHEEVEEVVECAQDGIQKEMGSMERAPSTGLDTTLASTLRREDSAHRTVMALSEEIVLLQSAVDSKQSEIRKYRLMGKLKDDKIHRLERMLRKQSREASGDDAEIQRLKNEVEFFKEKASKTPDATRYAIENMQLKEELSALKWNLECNNQKERFDEQIAELREKLLEVNEEIKRYRELDAEETRRNAEQAAVSAVSAQTRRIRLFMRRPRRTQEGEGVVSGYFAHLAKWARTVMGVLTKPLAKLRIRMRRRRS